MPFKTDDAAELLAKQMQAFDLVMIRKKSLRQAAEVMGVSHMTVKAYVTTYKKALASERVTEDVEDRRAAFDAELEAIKGRALSVYDFCMGGKLDKDGKPVMQPLAAVGALNSYTATLAHQRAVQGLDTPKEVKADVDQTMRIIWDDSDDSTPKGGS